MILKDMRFYDIGNTPIYRINKTNIYLKMEKYNKNCSIKDRTAYFLIKDFIQKNIFNEKITIIESTSGNLGISLGYFAEILNIKFKAIIDETITKSKLQELEKRNIEYIKASIGDCSDYRSARIKLAKELNNKDNYFWINQYDNFSNFQAHYQTTAPEIWSQMNGKIDIVVVSIGTGGTITGVSKYLKEMNKHILIYGVEPRGSTIFGGEEFHYINVGVGLKGESRIISEYKNFIDFSLKVGDKEAIEITRKYKDIGFGISTGYSLVIALKLSKKYPNKNIVVVSADGIENYKDIIMM